MTEPVGSDDTPKTPTDVLQEALLAFTGCVGEALDVCSYGLTLGDSYVPFMADEDDGCDEDEEACEQAWVRVMGLAPAPGGTDSFGGEDCALVLRMDLEVGILRCFEIMEDGEAPNATAVMAAALQAMEDMNTIMCAALGCEVWQSINVGQWTPTGPLGGQYGGIWTFTVEL